MIEHTANPLRALSEWVRLIKPGGALILVVPHRDGTFDHRRPVTTMSHLISDFENEMGENDLTHVSEVLRLHDGSRDSGVHEISFRQRAERNPELRSLHHHVFDTRLVAAIVKWAGLELAAVEPLRPYHVVVIGRKSSEVGERQTLPDDALRAVLHNSPFRTDREGQ
jgi:SAM-dependent methyltransferase